MAATPGLGTVKRQKMKLSNATYNRQIVIPLPTKVPTRLLWLSGQKIKCSFKQIFNRGYLHVFLFPSFQQLTVNIFNIKFCRWLNTNRGSLVLEATALPSEPQPLPGYITCCERRISYNFAKFTTITILRPFWTDFGLTSAKVFSSNPCLVLQPLAS